MEFDLYYSPYCPDCTAAAHRRSAAWDRKRPYAAFHHIDAAVAAGVRTTPAVALNGRLVASGRLAPEDLARMLEKALAEEVAGGMGDQ